MVKKYSTLLILMVWLALLATGCGESTQPEKVEPGQVENGSLGQAQALEIFAVGESVKMGELVFIVNGVRTSQGGDFISPEEGNIYYLVDCTLENNAAESANISSLLMFKMVDGDGYNYNITIGPETKGSLDGELASGRKMRGELAFEVPVQASSLELIFEPNVFGTGQAIYKIQ